MPRFTMGPSDGGSSVPGQNESQRDRARREGASANLSRGEGSILSGGPVVDAGPDYTYRRVRLRRRDEVNPYADARDEQTGADPRLKRTVALGVACLLVLLAAVVLPSGWFSANMRGTTLAQWLVYLQQRVAGLVSLVTFQGGDYGMDFVCCRYLVVALAGAALGISGAVFQGSLKNALASPSTLGVMTGCNLGKIVYVLFFLNASFQMGGSTISAVRAQFAQMGALEYVWNVYGMALCALAGGFAVVSVVVLVATVAGRGRVSNVVMVITGQVLATVIGAAVSLMQYYFTETGDARAELIRNLQVETFSNTFRPLDVALVGIPVAVGLVIVLTRCSKLNLLAFSDEEARSMGLATRRARWVMVLTCTALTGVVVAFCGQVGMVGFVVPHLARRVVGPDFKYLVPASALLGAAFVVGAYFVASLFSEGLLASLGVFTSVIGGVVFLVIAVRQKGRSHGDWVR